MGETADTNSGWLASQLPALGVELRWITVVGDELERLTMALERALGRSDFTLTTGGLGPTEDDLTREGIAQVLGETITPEPDLLEELRTYFRERNMEMPARNMKQAGIIRSAHSLPNPLGTAPGWWVEKSGHVIIAMPGPPGELQHMWEHQVRPRIQQRAQGTVILSRTLKTIGLSEATVDEMVSHLHGGQNPYLGVYAKPDGIYLRVIARGASQEEASLLIHPIEENIRAVLGDYIWGADEETPQGRVGKLLTARGLSLATMESCTGGLLAGTVTEVVGSSAYFKGGIVLYTDSAQPISGVDAEVIETYGVASQQTAEAMARAAAQQLGADIGIGLTGVAEPPEPEGAPVGTVHIGIVHPQGNTVVHHLFPPRRELVKRRAVTMALLELCRVLSAPR